MSQGCYREPYIPSSFKGVPFKVMEASSEHGRRGAEGEFPFGEITGYADLGRKIRRYSIRARFDSNNHVTEAGALIAVVEATGPGPLLHPTRGFITAACVSLKITDKPEEEGGVTYADMEFVEANMWPNGFSLGGLLAGLAVGGIIGAARDSFKARYRPNTVQVFRQAGVVHAAQQQVDFVAGAYAQVTTDKLEDKQRNLVLNAMQSVSASTRLATSAINVDKALSLGMNAIAKATKGQVKYNTFRGLANSAARVSAFANPAGDAENAVYMLVRVIAGTFMAEGSLESENVNTGTLFNEYDAVEAVLQGEQDLAQASCDNHLFAAINDFKINALSQIADKAYNSPGIVEYAFGGAVHPLVAAYAVYGDAKRHRDLEQINVLTAAGRFGANVFAMGA